MKFVHRQGIAARSCIRHTRVSSFEFCSRPGIISREFISGRRRKLGVVTLVMACVFAGGWVRSLYQGDYHQSLHRCIGSASGAVLWERHQYGGAALIERNRSGTPYDPFTDAGMSERWSWKWCGFGYAKYEVQFVSKDGSRRISFGENELYRIPYWSLVVPLMVLSSYCLLSKPQVSTPAKQVEPG